MNPNATKNRAASARSAGARGQKHPESAVQAELRPGQSIELLKELHILTREGRLNQDSRRKLKQVEHLVQFIEKLLNELQPQGAELSLADHGAGKSYLGFILYDL
nr:methyltransferase [Ottowia sp.]